MKLPDKAAHYDVRVRLGRYVARRLRRDGKTQLAADVTKVTEAVLATGRAKEDAEWPLQDALADRDAADDDLDDTAKTARARMAGRSVDAPRTAPYTYVFPEGIDYYIAAPLDQEVPRYTELSKRLADHLEPKDPVRVEALPAIKKGLEAFSTASKAVDAARTELALADTRQVAAEEAWDRQIEKTYGVLVAEMGRARAERFFPKARKARKGGGDDTTEPK